MSVALLAARPRHRPGGWSPKELGTLSLWLDADDPSTITISTGVSQWDDKSGNGRNVTQGTGANQPSYVRGARNGRGAVRFDGSNDSLDGGDTLDILTGGISVMAVSINNDASSGTTTADTILAKYTTGGSGDYYLNRNGFVVAIGGAAKDTRDTSNPTTLQAIGAVTDRQSGVTGYRDGTAGTPVTTGFPNTTSYDRANNFLVGARNTAASPQQVLNGDVCEVVVSLATWTTSERQKLEGYLAHKWGLAGSLVAGHPYKDAAP